MELKVVEQSDDVSHVKLIGKLDVDAPLEERRAGGMGIQLVRSMFDRIDYSRDEGINRLELQLKLASESVENN